MDRDLGEKVDNIKTDQQVILINQDEFRLLYEINRILDVRGNGAYKFL